MSSGNKVSPKKRHKQNNRWLAVFYAMVLIAVIGTVAVLWGPSSNKPASNQQNSDLNNGLNTMPGGFKHLATDYLNVMKNLNSTQTKTEMLALLSPRYNQTDLFTWEGSKLKFANDPAGSFEDPFQILDSGDGICVQWSIVYVSACLALGYQSRLVVAVDTASWTFIHVWAEDYYQRSWVPVDPSDKAWNSPYTYLSWDWGPSIGSTVRIYAFEDGSYQDVTATYSVA